MKKKNAFAIDFYQKKISTLELRQLKIKKKIIFLNYIYIADYQIYKLLD